MKSQLSSGLPVNTDGTKFYFTGAASPSLPLTQALGEFVMVSGSFLAPLNLGPSLHISMLHQQGLSQLELL